MRTGRSIVALIIGTALVWVAPGATADSPPAAAPDRTKPVASGKAAPVPAPKSEPQPGSGPTPQASAERGFGPTRGHSPERGSPPAPGHSPEAGSGSTHGHSAEPGSGPPPKPSPQLGSGPPPKPSPQLPAVEAAEPSPRAPAVRAEEPIPSPTGVAQPSPTNGEAVCTVTSAGLTCPPNCTVTSAGPICLGNPNCVVTSAGMSCDPNCTVTSVGLSCPQTEVSPNPPVSGGPKRTEPPTVRGESESESEHQAESEVGRPIVPRVEEATAGELPFTGAPIVAWLVLGFAMLAGGALLRRWTATATPAVELVGGAARIATPPNPGPNGSRPSAARVLLLPLLAFLACGMLLFRRTRLNRSTPS